MAELVKVTQLPRKEMLFYLIGSILLIVLSILSIIRDSWDTENTFLWRSSWISPDYQRDNSDSEWKSVWRFMLADFKILWLYLTLIIDFISKRYFPNFNQHIILIYSIVIFVKFYTITGLLLVLGPVFVLYYSTKLFQSKAVVWILSSFIIILMEFASFRYFLANSFINASKDMSNLFMYRIIYFFFLLRLISFCLDKIDAKSTQYYYTLKNFVSYSIYPSFMYPSPFISFENFFKCFINGINNYNFKAILIQFIRILFWIFITELASHYTLAFALHESYYLIDTSSKFSLAASLGIKGSLFTAKYIVYYGLTTVVNQQVGMQTTDLPRCIFLIHTNAELWRYFDTGIYQFIKNYLYVPLGGNKISKLRQLISLVLSFTFISYWHGQSNDIKLWSLGNLMMVLGEMIFSNYLRHRIIIKNSLMKRRLVCLLMALWQLILYFIAFFFLSNLNITLALYKKLLLEDFCIGFFTLLIWYYFLANLRIDYLPLKI